ncbi:type II toxin-antitoxin system VapC family toxin [Sphaerobacter sp.]|uniref:type II toxin-antitoxin system VapC family toxin n=1 Tax=Sphaerobacter sp. TaxID=2099654 RepID=UPI001E06B074|nr:type II toxin-antitoxin system VapC family toxin [Sphaerobacter sp.]MBX5446146.1 type II toxin-antitoxin system VapC family toxin [Sphaerobacter sp.]
MIVLDTTVLTYAVGSDHPLREPCRRLLAAHGDGRVAATTTIEVIQEFAHVRARRRSRSDAVMLARYYAVALPLLTTLPDDLELGLALYERVPALGAFDAVLAAVALNRGASALVSADRAFAGVPHLQWIDPASPALAHLIEQ